MEEKKPEVVGGKPKKSKTALIVIIMLIVGLLLGVGGSYYYFKVMDNDKNTVKSEEKSTKNKDKEESKTVEVKNLDVLSDIVQNNFNKFMNVSCGIYAKAEYFKPTKVNSSNIDNTVAYGTVSTYFFNNKGSISADEFEKTVKMYFGKNYKYQHQEQKICTNHRYNASTNSYEYVEPACGCTTGPYNIEYRITKAELSGDKMILNVKVLFPGKDTDRDNKGYVKYYSDANLTKPVSDLYYISGYGDPDAPITDSDHNLAKGGNYKFVMQKYDDNNYSFISSEPID